MRLRQSTIRSLSKLDRIWNEDRVRRKAMLKDALTPQAKHHFTRFDGRVHAELPVEQRPREPP